MTQLWFESALLPHGWSDRVRVRIADGRIAGVEAGVDPRPADERHWAALPGMPNLHSHAFQRGMAGLAEWRGAERDSFWTWRDLMYRFANRIGPAELQAIASMAFVEMLESGFTCVAEFHYIHRDPAGAPFANPAEMGCSLAAAAADVGIGLTLLPVFYCSSGFGEAPPKDEQRRFINNVDEYARLLDASRDAINPLPFANVGVAPHSLRAVPAAELAALLATIEPGMPVHIHIAEQVGEVDDCLAATGQRPVEWLLDHAPVDGRWCLVHATHSNEAEIRAIARSGAVVGLCPITEANLGDGVFPAASFSAAGGRWGVGSDSNVLIAMAEELRTLEYAQRMTERARNVLASPQTSSIGRSLFEQAAGGGGQAIGASSWGLHVGAAADFLTLSRSHETLAGKTGDTILDAFVFANRGDMIDCVWHGGRQRVRNGRHVARAETSERFIKTMSALTS